VTITSKIQRHLEGKRNLPHGWRWVSLGELSDPAKGSSRIGPFGSSLRKDELSESGIPVIGIENVLPNNFEHCFKRFISVAKYAELEDYTVKPGDVLVSTMGTIGRGAVVPNNIKTAIIDSHLFRFRLNRSEADPSFICYAINGFGGLRQELETKSSGAIMAGLNTKILRECIIPLPPLPEQQRIAGIMREQMEAVGKARAAAQDRLAAVKDLPAAFLRQVFPKPGQPLPDGWRWVKLEDVVDVRDGTHDTPQYVNKGIPLITSKNLKPEGIDFDNPLYISEEDHNQIKKRSGVIKGDILFAMIGTIGNPVIVETEKQFSIKNVALFKFENSPVLNVFFYYLLSSRMILNQLDKNSQGGIQKFVSLAVLRNLQIPLPPNAEQQRIAGLLREQMVAVETASAAAEEELNSINSLPAALLRRAFNGEI
jgi:type I restriction enzyme S subunit